MIGNLRGGDAAGLHGDACAMVSIPVTVSRRATAVASAVRPHPPDQGRSGNQPWSEEPDRGDASEGLAGGDVREGEAVLDGAGVGGRHVAPGEGVVGPVGPVVPVVPAVAVAPVSPDAFVVGATVGGDGGFVVVGEGTVVVDGVPDVGLVGAGQGEQTGSGAGGRGGVGRGAGGVVAGGRPDGLDGRLDGPDGAVRVTRLRP